MGNVFYFDWEIKFMQFLQSLSNPILTNLAKFFTLLGDEYLLIVILGLFYWSYKKDLGKKISLALCGSMMMGTLIKSLVLRRRPYMDNKEVKCIRAAHPDDDIMNPKLQGFSCPSLHSAMSFSVYGTIFKNIINKGLKILCILLPICIGLSRVYLGVHYPTDVLLGWVLGIISVFLFGFIEKKYGYKKGFIIILIVSLIGFIYCRDAEFYSGYGVTLGLFLGFLFEEKKVNFDNTNKWYSTILRPVIGVLIFVLVSKLLKVPVNNISDENYLILLYRIFRYSFSTFIIIGIYPYLFNKIKFLK